MNNAKEAEIMAHEYIPRDPRTGRPLVTGRRRRKVVDTAYRPSEGVWDAISIPDVLPLATGALKACEVQWGNQPHLVSRLDGVRALPRVSRKSEVETHQALVGALSDLKPEVRIAGLFALPYCALNIVTDLFEHLHELLEDVDFSVRKAASDCLATVAPVFPSATEETLRRELRSSVGYRSKAAFKGLRDLCQVWPEVVVVHLDELLREDDVPLRTEASKLLPRLSKTRSAAVWDLIGWSLQDEAATVRVHAARTLATLANSAPRLAAILLETALFDEDDAVRTHALRSLNRMDVTGFRMKRLCLDGARDRHRSIRQTCILMLPRLLIESEVREHANQLLLQETDPELCDLLRGMIIDLQLEGSEEEKNRFLAPLPVDEQRMEGDDHRQGEPPQLLADIEEGVPEAEYDEHLLGEGQLHPPQEQPPEGQDERPAPDEADIGLDVGADHDVDEEPDWQDAVEAFDPGAHVPDRLLEDDDEN